MGASNICATTSNCPLKSYQPPSARPSNRPVSRDSETNEDQEDHHVIATVVTESRTDVKVVATLVSIKEVPETTSNQNSVVEWEVSDEGVEDRHQVVDSVRPHLRPVVGLVPHLHK